ncbi:MAG: NAD-dependent epimerase/dehydratase family protein [Negativicutes bacterium]|nr:NAD-dependent epimerase/dehydratase family protein [Negativicutes bacterium]
MNILVIGGNGFIGSHLVDLLLIKGHNIRVFDNSYEKYRKPLSNVDYRISNLENIPDLYEALLSIDIIFYLASSSVPSTSNIDIVSDIKKNLIPTLNLLNLAIKLGLKRIIYFSSGGAVYGEPSAAPINEDHALNPISSYGIIKVTNEMYFSLFQRIYGLRPLILRPSNPYGPRQGHYIAQGVISTFLRKAKLKEPLTVYGDGNSTKDYIYVKDLINLTYDLSMNNAVGVFNLGCGKGTKLNQIIELIEKITGNQLEVRYVDKQIYDVEHFILDISKAIQIIGDYSFTPLPIGILETWKWLNLK